jgi:hypothetical protein
MKREWTKYINKQKYSECQLITALNAHYYLTGKTINQESKKYEQLVDLVKARNGSAICIEESWGRLDIYPFNYRRYLSGDFPLPFEINVWYKKCGFHSVCAVDYNKEVEALRVPNLKWLTTFEGWIFIEDLRHYLDDMNKGWCCRSFRLIGGKA